MTSDTGIIRTDNSDHSSQRRKAKLHFVYIVIIVMGGNIVMGGYLQIKPELTVRNINTGLHACMSCRVCRLQNVQYFACNSRLLNLDL